MTETQADPVPARLPTIAPFPVVPVGGTTFMAYLDDVAQAAGAWREKHSEPDPPYGDPMYESCDPAFSVTVARQIRLWFKRLGVKWDGRGAILGYEQRKGYRTTITWDIPHEGSSIMEGNDGPHV